MTIAKVGDLIPKSGIYTEPGVVIEKKDNGTVTVDTDPMAINKYHRYSNTTGLSEEEKVKFNSILDEIYKNDDQITKINEIQKEIDVLKTDHRNKNIVLYLRNQQAGLIREVKQLPQFYNQEEGLLKF
ncbi:MAG: hypothetical protein KA436_10570 [Oligoflexales bacterium]|nr:hypothetical protein [Oligoflexales bacterium]